MLKWRASCESLKVGRVWALSQMLSRKAFEQGSALKCFKINFESDCFNQLLSEQR